MNNQPMTTGDEPSLSQPTDDQQEPGLDIEAALVKAVHHQDTEIRYRAFEQLAAIGSERAVDLLEQAANDPNVYVRMHAIKALGITQSERAVDILLHKFQAEADYQARGQVIKALGKTGSERAVDPLIQHIQSDATVWERNCAVDSLGQIGSPRAVAALVQALYDHNSIRRSVGLALRQIGENHPDAIQPVIDQFMKILSGPPGEDRSRAIHILADVRPAGLATHLLEALKDPDRPPQQRIAAVLTLRTMGDKQFTKPMLELLPIVQDGRLRYWIEKTLSDIRVREDIPAVVDLLKHEDWQIRRSAVRILGRRDARSAVPHIIKLLEEDRAPLRKAAADALGKLYRAESVSQAVGPLIHTLDDRGKTVRAAAARALGRMHQADNISQAVEPLIDALSDPADIVREAASFALGRMRSPGVVPVVEQSLVAFLQNSDDVYERRAAIDALYWLRFYLPNHSGNLISILQAALYDPDSYIAQTARAILYH